MATMKIKKDDMVQVIAGKDKGKEGKVLSVDAKNNKVLVEGVNIVHKHSKPSMQNQQAESLIRKLLSTFQTLCISTRVSRFALASRVRRRIRSE